MLINSRILEKEVYGMFRFSKKSQTSPLGGGLGGPLGGLATGAARTVGNGIGFGAGFAIGKAKWIGALFFYCMFAICIHLIDITAIGFRFGASRIALHVVAFSLTLFWILLFSENKPPIIHLFTELLIVFGIVLILPLGLEIISNLIIGRFTTSWGIIKIVFSIINVWFLPIWLYWALFVQNYMREAILTKLLGAAIIIMLLAVAPLYALYEGGYIRDVDDNGMEAQLGFAMTGVNLMKRAVTNAPAILAGTYEDATTKGQQLWNQTVNPDFESNVEQTHEQEVGIKIDNIEGLREEPFIHQSLILYSMIRAKTLDKPVPIKMSCFADRDINDDKIDVKGVVKESSAYVTSIQSIPFVCEFEENTLQDRTYSIQFDATFPFTTSSYIRRYVIDQDRLDSMRQQEIDPFEQYAITDKEPKSIFTPGPVKLGVTTPDPLIVLPSNESKQVYLYIKMENNFGWSGKINNIHYLNFMIPKGFKLSQGKGGPEKFACTYKVTEANTDNMCNCNPTDSVCINDCNNYNVYSIDIEDLKVKNKKTKEMELPSKIIVGCWMRADPSIRILRQQPIAITSFRAISEYNYTVFRKLSVSMHKMDGLKDTDRKEIKVCGYNITTPIDGEAWDEITSMRKQDLDAVKETLKGKSCPAVLFGIAMSYGHSFSYDAQCIGEDDEKRCGRTEYTEKMVEALEGSLSGKIKTVKDFNDKDDFELIKEAETITDTYVDKILKPLLKDDSNKLASLMGKYECGKGFSYGNPKSIEYGYYFCIEAFVPKAVSYAAAFEYCTTNPDDCKTTTT
jgi:hypothetical protein